MDQEKWDNRLYINFGTASPFGSLLTFVERKKSNRLVKLWKSSLTISAKRDEVGAACQVWTARGGRSGIADAHRGDGKRFVVQADEKLTAFLELESTTRATAKSTLSQIIQHF
jgi:hypothetical protein